MNIEFPHLNDTPFPGISDDNNLSGVDVYKYQNDFDYYRWRNQVSVKLLNVLWNSNYADVPYFDSDAKRDAWFDKQSGIIQPLLTPFNSTPDTTIQLPVPYNDAYKYNYAVVDMPIQTSANEPLDYESEETRVKRWYYFIEDMNQLAPNTTQFVVTLDYWTTFIHSVDINYLMLERGHAPMTKTTVEQFLENPIENNQYLLADDFNYGKDTVISKTNYKPIGNGTKYVLFCAPYKADDFAFFDTTNYSGNSTPPTYANTSERWGHQLTVNDYEWKYGNVNYSNSQLPISNRIQTGVFNGCECFAIAGNQAMNFFNDCARNCVNFIHGIQAVFILSEDLFNKSNPFTFRGYTLYVADKNKSVENITLHKSDFKFDSKYSDITKLYTFPYSSLEVTDDYGNSFEAKIENCGNIEMHKDISLVYPFLNYNAFFTNINGTSETTYTWKVMSGETLNKKMWGSDYQNYMFNWDIPTYSLFISSEAEYAANNFSSMRAKRAEAIKDYRNATRFANTNAANVADTMATNTANVNATGATSNTNQTNTNNANANICGSVANDGKGTIGAYGGDGANEEILSNNNTTNSEITSLNIQKVQDDYVSDNRALWHTAVTNNEYAALSGLVNMAAGIAGMATTATASAGSGATQGAAGGPAGAAAGAAASASSAIVNSGINVAVAGASTVIGITNSMDITGITAQLNTEKTSHATDNMRDVNQKIRETNRKNTEESNRAMRYATAQANTANANNTANIVSTNNINAGRTQTTETNNADYTRDANIAANKANLVQAQLNAEVPYKNSRLQRPTTQGEYGGTGLPDALHRRGIRVNIRTQNKSAIAQAGDAFLRFGYALHQVWNMGNGFNYMKHFTFWKAEDVWVNDGTGVANIAVNIITDILLKGVTVWAKPEEIGMVSIYDNI